MSDETIYKEYSNTNQLLLINVGNSYNLQKSCQSFNVTKRINITFKLINNSVEKLKLRIPSLVQS